MRLWSINKGQLSRNYWQWLANRASRENATNMHSNLCRSRPALRNASPTADSGQQRNEQNMPSQRFEEATDGSVFDLRHRGLHQPLSNSSGTEGERQGLSPRLTGSRGVKPLADHLADMAGVTPTPWKRRKSVRNAKNASLDLQSVLNLNALTLADPAGVVVPNCWSNETQCSPSDSAGNIVFKARNSERGMLFTITCKNWCAQASLPEA